MSVLTRFCLATVGAATLGLLGSATPVLGQTPTRVEIVETAPTGWIGVQYEFRRELILGSGQSPRTEVRIEAVFRGGAAHQAGLRPGDIVERFNGAVPTEGMMRQLASQLRPGDSVHVLARRRGETVDRWVVAQARPRQRSIPRAVVRLSTPDRTGVVQVQGRSWSPNDPDGFTVVFQSPGQTRSFSYSIETSQRGDVPFEAFVVRTPQTDSLMALINIVRTQIQQSASPTNRAARESLQRLNLTQQLDQLQNQLVLVSRERLRLSEFDREAGQVRVRVSPRSALAPLVRSTGSFFLGAEVTSVNGELGRYFNVDSGVLVSSVPEGTPAVRLGLRAGDVIVGTRRGPVRNFSQLRQTLYRYTLVELTVVREGERIALRVPAS